MIYLKDNLPRYTMRINRIMLDKLAYISEYEVRTINKQLEFLVRRCIYEFESMHGEINFNEIKRE